LVKECSACKQAIRIQAKFCDRCGRPQDLAR
jgi:rRNA maturation endonuclease Nob1